MSVSKFRQEIDELDNDIFMLICKRVAKSVAVAQFKSKRGIPRVDQQRESEILSRVEAQATEKGWNTELVKEIFMAILKLSKDVQKQEG